MPEFETIRYAAADDHIARITLARPDKRNAMNAVMFRELGDAAQQAADDHDVWAVLVAAEGPVFCAGIDLTIVGELGPNAAGDGFKGFGQMAQRPFRILASMPKPTVAAVQGHAVGAGCQLALACDLRIASSDARLGIFEPKYGLIPDLGGIHHLTRIVGSARTKDIVWTTRLVEAEEAERLGLVNRVVAWESLAKEADQLLGEILAHPPIVIRESKHLIGEAVGRSLFEEMEAELDAQQRCLTSPDNAEAVASTFERRPPHYTGR